MSSVGKSLAWMVVMGAMSALALPACVNGREPRAATEIRIGAATPTNAGAGGAVVGLDYLTAALVRESLASVSRDGRVVPRLAERWDVSPDGKVWTFHLAPDLTFHDGTAVTSETFVPLLRARLTGLSQVTSIAADGAHAVRIELQRATPFLLEEVAFQSLGIGPGSRIGTGPFRLAEASEDKIRFEAFARYRQGAPDVSGISLSQYPSLRSAWAAMMRDEVDVLYEVSNDAREFVEAESSVNVAQFLRPYVYLLGLNHRREPFGDPEVRRALNLAIDRAVAIEQGLRGFGQPAFDHLWPFHWAVNPENSIIPFDRERASAMLDANYPIKAGLNGAMPARFRFSCLVYEPFARLGLVIQRQLANVGIDMKLELVPLSVLAPRAVTGDFDAFIFEMASARSLSFPYMFWHSSTQPGTVPSTGYGGSDAALDRIRYATSDDEILRGVADLQSAFRDDPPAVFIAWPSSARAVSRRFEVATGSDEDIFHSIATWKPGSIKGSSNP